jgi:hypothetical protein
LIYLQLVLNPSKQASTLATGLEYISGLIVQSSMREDFYYRKYESNDNDRDDERFMLSLMRYKDTLKELYTRILKYQATIWFRYSQRG